MTTPAQPTEREWEMALEVWGALQDKANVGRKTGSAIIAAALAQARAEGRAEAIEQAAKVCDLYADVNIEAAGDTILLDPILNGESFSVANLRVTEGLIVDGCIHSSKFHAAQDIAANIRALLPKDPANG